MTNDPLDPFSAEALLAGTNDVAAADPALVSLLEGLRSPANAGELVGADGVFASIRAAQGPATGSMIGRVSRRTAAIAAASIVAFGGVAAASVGTPVVSKIFHSDDRPTLVGDDTEQQNGGGTGSGASSEQAPTASHVAEPGSDDAPGNDRSSLARSDCGKPDTTPANPDPTLTPEPLGADAPAVAPEDACAAFDNHGQAVSASKRNTPAAAVDKQNNGQGNDGQANVDKAADTSGPKGEVAVDAAPGQQKAGGPAAPPTPPSAGKPDSTPPSNGSGTQGP